MSKTIVITSGYFNPIHPGHIDCFEMSKELGDELWVIINNDYQARLKRGVESFQDQDYRMRVVSSCKYVDYAILSIDQDATVCASLISLISLIYDKYGSDTHIIFTKGGDRFAYNIPERDILDQYGVKIVDGMGDKTHNSSDYVQLK